MQEAFISIGSNLGDKLGALKEAKLLLEQRVGPVFASRVYCTNAWGYESENSFYNAILYFETNIEAIEILASLKEIEKEMGRVKSGTHYEDRVIDLDLIFLGEMQIQEENLIVPHPKMHLRTFVLLPILDLADPFHPTLQKYCSTLYSELPKEEGISLVNERL